MATSRPAPPQRQLPSLCSKPTSLTSENLNVHQDVSLNHHRQDEKAMASLRGAGTGATQPPAGPPTPRPHGDGRGAALPHCLPPQPSHRLLHTPGYNRITKDSYDCKILGFLTMTHPVIIVTRLNVSAF